MNHTMPFRISYLWSSSTNIIEHNIIYKNAIAESGIKVLDLGCGGGDRAINMSKLFPKSTFVGYDVDENAIDAAKQKLKQLSNNNISFGVHNICNMPSDWSGSCDLVVVFDVIHDLPYPATGLSEIKRIMKSDGYFFMRDIYLHSDPGDNVDIPHGSIMYTTSLYYCVPQSLHHDGGEGLGSTWGVEKATQMLDKAGFANVRKLGTEGLFVDFLAEKGLE